MTGTLAHVSSSESTQRELFNEYQHDRVLKGFQIFLHSCAFDESSLSIERVKWSSYPCLWTRDLRLFFGLKHKDAKIFENHLKPVMSVFIG